MSSSEPTTHADDGTAPARARPQLLFFYTRSSGQSRPVEGFLAQVLQRRRNHETFHVHRLDYEEHGDLARRCGVSEAPALVVVREKRVQARIERPRGCRNSGGARALAALRR